MAVLDIQRRSQQIGRIRIGVKVKTDKGKDRLEKLSTFRFTTASRSTADAIAGLFGGEVREWEQQWEVITDRSEIGVTVPPRDAVISQWYEMWNRGGCIRRCDSQTEQISNGPCLCPHAENPDDLAEVAAKARERAELAKQNPPQACKLVTRINVMIPDLPGLGVFRLDTGSFYAAGESGDKADLMEMARERNVFLPAMLRIEQRKRVANGRTTTYPVPVLEILSTFRAIASGELEAGGMAAQLPPAPGEPQRAIASAPAAVVPTGPEQAPPDEADNPLANRDEEAALKRAQEIADATPEATGAELQALAEMAEREGVADQFVCTDREADTWEELLPYLRDLWRRRAAARRGSAA